MTISLLVRKKERIKTNDCDCFFAGPKLFKEPSFKSNKFIIHNALSRCCLAGKVNESQKNKIAEVGVSCFSFHTNCTVNVKRIGTEKCYFFTLLLIQEMEKSSANHFLILFRDSNCQFRGVYTMNPDTQELVRLAGMGPRSINSSQVESIFKYSSDRKQFSPIPSKTMGMSVDAFTISSQLWQGGGGGGGGGGSRRTSVTKKVAISKWGGV